MNRRTHNPRTAGDLVRIDRRTGCPSAGPTITASRTKRSRRRRARSPTLLVQSTHGLARGRPAFHLRRASAVIARETPNARIGGARDRRPGLLRSFWSVEIQSRRSPVLPTDDEGVRAAIAQSSGEELVACRSLLDFALSELGAWSGRPIKRGADRVILAEAVRATKTFGAVIRLCEAGFGEQALMLDRSLFEGVAVAHWVAANRREAVRLFIRHERFSNSFGTRHSRLSDGSTKRTESGIGTLSGQSGERNSWGCSTSAERNTGGA
jgi:hypothetical protein